MPYCPPGSPMHRTMPGNWMSSTVPPTSDRFARPGQAAMSSGPSEPRVLVVDTDPALLGLLEAWLSERGCRVVAEGEGEGRNDFDLVVVDVPFPRRGETNALKRIASEHPGVPVLALSSSFFARVE